MGASFLFFAPSGFEERDMQTTATDILASLFMKQLAEHDDCRTIVAIRRHGHVDKNYKKLLLRFKKTYIVIDALDVPDNTSGNLFTVTCTSKPISHLTSVAAAWAPSPRCSAWYRGRESEGHWTLHWQTNSGSATSNSPPQREGDPQEGDLCETSELYVVLRWLGIPKVDMRFDSTSASNVRKVADFRRA